MAYQVLARVIGDDTFSADRAHEADMVEDVLKRLVGLAQGAEGLIEQVTERLGGVVGVCLQKGPAGTLGDEEAIIEIGVLAVLRLRHLL